MTYSEDSTLAIIISSFGFITIFTVFYGLRRSRCIRISIFYDMCVCERDPMDAEELKADHHITMHEILDHGSSTGGQEEDVVVREHDEDVKKKSIKEYLIDYFFQKKTTEHNLEKNDEM